MGRGEDVAIAILELLMRMGITLRTSFTGYHKNMKDKLLLIDSIHLPLCRPEYVPTEGVTHCNQYVAEVCSLYGFRGLGGLFANEIIEVLDKHDQWNRVPMERAQDMANDGTLIVAGYQGNPHGHVNIICPGSEKTSGRWGKVPSVANVGKEIFIGKGINWAFSTFPNLWAWRPTI